MGIPLHVLIVEDSEDDTLLLLISLKAGGYEPVFERVETEEAMRHALSREPWDLILSDYTMPRFSGLAALALFRRTGLDIPFIIVTGTIGEEIAAEAMVAGASDYVMKNNLSRLVPAIEREMREAEGRRRARESEEALRQSEERYRSISESISDFVYSCAKPEGGEHTIDWLAGAVERITGYSIEEIHSWGCWKDLVHPDSAAVFEENILNVPPGASRQCDLQIVRKDGEIRWIRSSCRAVVQPAIGEVHRLHGGCEDITERKKAVEELSASRQQLIDIIEFLPDATFVIDRNKRVIAWNRALEEMTGVKKDEVLGMGDHAYAVPFYGEDRIMLVDLVLVPDSEAEGQYSRFKRQGSRVVGEGLLPQIYEGKGAYFWGVASTLFDGKGNVVGAIESVRDITEMKNMEKSLRLSEEKYRAIFENATEGIFQTTPEGRYRSVNPAFARMFGYGSPDEMVESVTNIGRQLYVNPHDRERLAKLLEKHGAIQGFEVELYRRDRTRFQVSINVHAVRAPDGTVLYWEGTNQDITERKKIEKDLRQSEEKYRTIFENAVEGIFQTLPEGRFISVNPAMAHMHGYESPEEMLVSITDIGAQLYVSPEDRKAYRRILEERGVVEGFEAPVYRKDGAVIWTSTSARAVRDESGNIVRFEGTAEDITVRREAEEDLRKTMDRLRKSLAGTIQAMSLTVETRDPYTAGHQRRVSALARALAQAMDFPANMIDAIRMAGAIHDIGKMSVPAEILSKPGHLSAIERRLIEAHSQKGYDILKDVGLPFPVAEIVLQHHERLDGSGYPQGLRGNQILPEAQILIVADVVEAISSHRPYRPAHGIDIALGEIEANKGILYNAEIVDACLGLFRQQGFRFDEPE